MVHPRIEIMSAIFGIEIASIQQISEKLRVTIMFLQFDILTDLKKTVSKSSLAGSIHIGTAAITVNRSPRTATLKAQFL